MCAVCWQLVGLLLGVAVLALLEELPVAGFALAPAACNRCSCHAWPQSQTPACATPLPQMLTTTHTAAPSATATATATTITTTERCSRRCGWVAAAAAACAGGCSCGCSFAALVDYRLRVLERQRCHSTPLRACPSGRRAAPASSGRPFVHCCAAAVLAAWRRVGVLLKHHPPLSAPLALRLPPLLALSYATSRTLDPPTLASVSQPPATFKKAPSAHVIAMPPVGRSTQGSQVLGGDAGSWSRSASAAAATAAAELSVSGGSGYG